MGAVMVHSSLNLDPDKGKERWNTVEERWNRARDMDNVWRGSSHTKSKSKHILLDLLNEESSYHKKFRKKVEILQQFIHSSN